MMKIGSINAEFARGFLTREGIVLMREDLGGTQARRVDFRPASGRSAAAWWRNALPRPFNPPPARKGVGRRRTVLTGNPSLESEPRHDQIHPNPDRRRQPEHAGLLNHALASNGFDVAQAEDGMAALDWLESNEVDVVITDINMPRLDGFGLIERLREGERHRDRPILVLTTESSDEKKARAAPPARPGGS
jgi:two-component system chemotaxis response regulator CheY